MSYLFQARVGRGRKATHKREVSLPRFPDSPYKLVGPVHGLTRCAPESVEMQKPAGYLEPMSKQIVVVTPLGWRS